jgi:carbonic anhydrase/acetyltransferase-like protein (isoleucine patch superfamily)
MIRKINRNNIFSYHEELCECFICHETNRPYQIIMKRCLIGANAKIYLCSVHRDAFIKGELSI